MLSAHHHSANKSHMRSVLALSARAVDTLMAKAAKQMRELHENRPVTQLLHPDELPKRERVLKRVEEHFWRASASQHAKPAAGTKRRRLRTLARGPAKRARKPGVRRCGSC